MEPLDNKFYVALQLSCRPSGTLPQELKGEIDFEKPKSFFESFMKPWETLAVHLRERVFKWRLSNPFIPRTPFDCFTKLIPQLNTPNSLSKDQILACQTALSEIFCHYGYVNSFQLNLLKVIHIEIIACLNKLGKKEVPKNKLVRNQVFKKTDNQTIAYVISEEEENQKLNFIEKFQKKINKNFFNLNKILISDRLDSKEIEKIKNDFLKLYNQIKEERSINFSNEEIISIQKYLSVLITVCQAHAVLLPYLIMTLYPIANEDINILKQLKFTKKTIDVFAWQNTLNERLCEKSIKTFQQMPSLANQFKIIKQNYSETTLKAQFLYNEMIKELQSQFTCSPGLIKLKGSIQNLTNQENTLQIFWLKLKNNVDKLQEIVISTSNKQISNAKRNQNKKIVIPHVDDNITFKLIDKSSLPRIDSASKMVQASRSAWIDYLKKISQLIQEFDKALPKDWADASFGLFSRLDLLKLNFLNILDFFDPLGPHLIKDLRSAFISFNAVALDLRLFYQRSFSKDSLKNNDLEFLDSTFHPKLLEVIKKIILSLDEGLINLPENISLDDRLKIEQLKVLFSLLGNILLHPGGAFFICAPLPKTNHIAKPFTYELIRQQANQALSILQEYLSKDMAFINFSTQTIYKFNQPISSEKVEPNTFVDVYTDNSETFNQEDRPTISINKGNFEIGLPKEFARILLNKYALFGKSAIQFSANFTQAIQTFGKKCTKLSPIESSDIKELRTKLPMLLKALIGFQKLYDNYFVSLDKLIQNGISERDKEALMYMWGGNEEVLQSPLEILKKFDAFMQSQVSSPPSIASKALFSKQAVDADSVHDQEPIENEWTKIKTNLNLIKFYAEEIIIRLQGKESFKNFFQQILFQLKAVEELINKLETRQNIDKSQAHSLIRHLASILEQSLKALAHYYSNEKASLPIDHIHDLEKLLESIPCEQNLLKHSNIISIFNNFLSVPGRYLIGMHPLIELLEKIEKTPSEGLLELNQYASQCLEFIAGLFSNIHKVNSSNIRPQNTLDQSIFSLLAGVENAGLLSRVNIQISKPNKEKLQEAICELKNMIPNPLQLHEIPTVSFNETNDQIAKRRQLIRFDFHSLKAVCESLEELINNKAPESWCASYASAILLRCAVLIEKGTQSFLTILPISSDSKENEHIIFSQTENVPLRFTHNFSKWLELIEFNLADDGLDRESEEIKKMREQTSWLECIIRQLYRYPYDPMETRAGKLLLNFYTLSQLRSALHEGQLSSGCKAHLARILKVEQNEDLKAILDNRIKLLIETDLFQAVNMAVSEAKKILSLSV